MARDMESKREKRMDMKTEWSLGMPEYDRGEPMASELTPLKNVFSQFQMSSEETMRACKGDSKNMNVTDYREYNRTGKNGESSYR
jgi:hypothetical protein